MRQIRREYTLYLVGVRNNVPNKAQVVLLNLLFWSVGGSEATDLCLGASGNGNENGQASRKGVGGTATAGAGRRGG